MTQSVPPPPDSASETASSDERQDGAQLESSSEPLQFDRAEYEEAATDPTCTACQQAIDSEYFEVNGAVVCATCRRAISQIGTEGSSLSRFARALFAGAAVAVVGCLVYFAIGKLTGFEFGLIAVFIGYGVGVAVKWGCYGRGGWRYQALAMLLTYFAIVFTNIPDIIKALSANPSTTAVSGQSAVVSSPSAGTSIPTSTESTLQPEQPPTVGGFLLALGVLVLIACVAPFLAGFQNLIGLIIIAVGLWEAWKINRRPTFAISGPHRLTARPALATESPLV